MTPRRTGLTRAVPSALTYGAVGLALWPIPLVGLLHAEASAVVAASAFFVAGLASVRPLARGEGVAGQMRRHLGLLVVPWAMLTITLLWRPNCAYVQGLGLVLVMVPPSALFGVALAYALTATRTAWPRLWLVVIGLAVAVGGVVADLGVHPQLFTYNHVFGGVLGPIYDEELALRSGLVAFRGLTLGWVAWLVCWGRWRISGGGRRWALAGAGVAVLLGAGYLAAAPLGIQQTPARIERALGATATAGPFRFVYSADDVTPVRLARIADEALFRADQLRRRLGVRLDEPITVVLYPDPATKGALLGSRTTSVTPVWLPTPQIHMLASEVERSFGHELAHVAAREFGMPVVHASPAVGLVEGLAVAVEPPDGLPRPAALVAAGRALPGDAGGLDADPAEVVRRTMSPVGFWTARAGVAYTASGAFARWLLDTYGPLPLRRAYRSGRFDAAYGTSLDTLAARWGRDVAAQPADAEAVATAAWLFRQPSLFERRCPHHVPAYVRAGRDGWDALDRGEVTAASDAFERARRERPADPVAVAGWARLLASRGRIAPGAARRLAASGLDSLSTPAALAGVADVLRLAGLDAEADTLYARAGRGLLPTDRWGRLVLARRAALSAAALARLRAHLGTPERRRAARIAHAVEADDPLLAAVLWDDAERPAEAWRAARAARRTVQAAADRRTFALTAATLAYRAGDLDAAERLAGATERASRRDGETAQADRAADLVARVRWRRGGS